MNNQMKIENSRDTSERPSESVPNFLQTSIRIREARFEDIPGALPLAEEFFLSTVISKYIPFKATSTAVTLKRMIEGDGAVIFIAEKGDRVIGGIGGVLSLSPWNFDVVVSQEMFWFITAEHRGGTTALRLLRAYQQWAKEKGAEVDALAVMKSLNYEGVTKAYQHLGYECLEEHHMRRVK